MKTDNDNIGLGWDVIIVDSLTISCVWSSGGCNPVGVCVVHRIEK